MPQNKKKYDEEYLDELMILYNATIDCAYNRLSMNSRITFICSCGETHDKTFRNIAENGGALCKKCTLQATQKKTKETNMKNFGVENPAQNEEVKKKMKATNIANLGVEYPTQSKKVREKVKATNIINLGVENPIQNAEVKKKMKATNMIKFGVEYAGQNDEIKKKIKATNIINLGVENPSQNEKIKEKKVATSMKNFGVEYPMQNAEFSEKVSKTSRLYKDYILPSKKIIKIQGYEHYALDTLLYQDNIDENDIVTNKKKTPKIWYENEEGKKRRHFVDIFIPSQNKCIEVKSTWTAKKKEDNIFLKQNAGKAMGYEYEIWVYDNKGKINACYK
jgi:hypothetical protein